METAKLIKQLRATAEVLKPLTHSSLPGAATWNGTSYVKTESRTPDPQALAWFSILITIANLLEAQEAPPTVKQIAYLRRTLFGGMGSLNDLHFGDATTINDRLNEERRALFSAFND